MSRGGSRDGGLDLSLTGSQISTGSGRNASRSGAARGAKRPMSASSTRPKSNQNVSNRQLASANTSKRHSRSGSSSSLVDRNGRTGSARSAPAESKTQQSARDDFLSFFDAGGVQPKILKPGQRVGQKGTGEAARTAWGNDKTSVGGARGKVAHSMFRPISARSNDYGEEEDLLAFSMQDPPDLSLNLEDMDDLHLNTHRNSHHNDDLMELNSYHDSNPNTRRNSEQPFNTDRSATRELELNTHRRVSDGHYQYNEDPFNLNYRTSDDILNSHRSTYRDENHRSSRNAAMFSTQTITSEHLNHSSDRRNRNTPHLDIPNKSQKLNSIANNMTSQALSPGTKTPLENAFQNIKHKTPVNQVRQSPRNLSVHQNTSHSSHKLTEDQAARCLQRWFRHHLARRRMGTAAMRRLMDSKRLEKHQERERQEDELLRSADERKRQREEKARRARKQAIQELHDKREAKRLEAARIAEEEVEALQAAGKVGQGKSNVKRNTMPVSKKVVNGAAGKDEASNSRPGTAGSNNRRVEDLFEKHSPRGNPRDDRSSSGSEAGRSGVGSRSNQEGATASNHVTSKTTLEDLMDTLRKLEEDEDKFDTKGKNTTPQNWLDDLERQSESSKSDHITSEQLNSLQAPTKDNLKKNSFLTDEKLKSIISFLDEVETADRLGEIDSEINQVNDILERPAPLVPSGEEIAQLEQATAAAAEVTNTVLAQRLALDDKARTVSMLQKALNQQRELTVRHAKETEREMKKRLEVQKLEAEETIKRHLSFIDQLIDDKKSLGEKCEQLVKELKVVDKKYQDRIKGLTDGHEVEMRKIKDMHAAAEKLRRERWIDEKTKKIKEMTVKGLEPEIQRLIAKHKEDVRKIKAMHEAELLASDERAGQRYITMTEQLRDQLQQEKEAACARERELARQTYESQLQQEESAFQQQRRRLHAEVQEEKERLGSAATRQRAELDKLQRQLEDNHSRASDAMKSEYEKAREEQERRHATEVRQLREQLSVEKAAWEENYRKKQETWLLAKERELKDHVRRDRDKELEMVIGRLEEDGEAARDECERVAENRIKRIRDKYEGEIAELERSERMITEKYNQTKAQLAEYEGETERMKVTLKQKDKEVTELKKLLDKLNEERSHVSDVIRQEFADRIVATEEENKRIKTEMSEMKARHRIELERTKAEIDIITKTKEEEMDQLHQRVKQAIVKKEEVLNQLRQQFESAQKRADHLEGLLEQQRKQLLAKK